MAEQGRRDRGGQRDSSGESIWEVDLSEDISHGKEFLVIT